MVSATTRKHARSLIRTKHGTVTTKAEDGAKNPSVLRESFDRANHRVCPRILMFEVQSDSGRTHA